MHQGRANTKPETKFISGHALSTELVGTINLFPIHHQVIYQTSSQRAYVHVYLCDSKYIKCQVQRNLVFTDTKI